MAEAGQHKQGLPTEQGAQGHVQAAFGGGGERAVVWVRSPLHVCYDNLQRNSRLCMHDLQTTEFTLSSKDASVQHISAQQAKASCYLTLFYFSYAV